MKIKTAESLGAVHTHTHTHTDIFSEINKKINEENKLFSNIVFFSVLKNTCC